MRITNNVLMAVQTVKITYDAPKRAPPKPGARFERSWLQHGVKRSGVLGLVAHNAVSVRHLRGRKLTVACYYYLGNGSPLTDLDGRYRSADGKVSAATEVTPKYEGKNFKDIEVFIPSAQLHVKRSGKRHALKTQCRLFDGSKHMATGRWLAFDYLSGKPKPKPQPRAWVNDDRGFDVRAAGHRFDRVRVHNDARSPCRVTVEVHFTAPKASPMRFRTRVNFASGAWLRTDVFHNALAGRRKYAYTVDSSKYGCWGAKAQKPKRLFVTWCPGARCTPAVPGP